MKKEQALRQTVRSLIKEELSPSKKNTVLDQLRTELENVINGVLIENDVHKQGLSDGQCAKLYRELSDVLEQALDEYKTTRKPNEIEGFEDFERYINQV
jgi:hypothetical protein